MKRNIKTAVIIAICIAGAQISGALAQTKPLKLQNLAVPLHGPATANMAPAPAAAAPQNNGPQLNHLHVGRNYGAIGAEQKIGSTTVGIGVGGTFDGAYKHGSVGVSQQIGSTTVQGSVGADSSGNREGAVSVTIPLGK